MQDINKTESLTLNVGGASGGRKKRYQLDNGNFVYLDPSDTNIIARASEAFADFDDMKEAAQKFTAMADLEEETEDIELTEEEKTLKEAERFRLFKEAGEGQRVLDKRMRERIDTMFASEVADACMGDAFAFDLVDGKHRYEVVVQGLIKAYEANIQREVALKKQREEKAIPARYRKGKK